MKRPIVSLATVGEGDSRFAKGLRGLRAFI